MERSEFRVGTTVNFIEDASGFTICGIHVETYFYNGNISNASPDVYFDIIRFGTNRNKQETVSFRDVVRWIEDYTSQGKMVSIVQKGQ